MTCGIVCHKKSEIIWYGRFSTLHLAKWELLYIRCISGSKKSSKNYSKTTGCLRWRKQLIQNRLENTDWKAQTGDNSGSDPPLAFPNREVKPVVLMVLHMKCGRVKSCRMLYFFNRNDNICSFDCLYWINLKWFQITKKFDKELQLYTNRHNTVMSVGNNVSQ